MVSLVSLSRALELHCCFRSVLYSWWADGEGKEVEAEDMTEYVQGKTGERVEKTHFGLQA